MGQGQHSQPFRSIARRLPPRTCLRKGCCRVYHPARWNQRYCQQAECRRLVRRWQAAKRQRAHRRLPDNRKRHAEAEAIRRRNRTTRPPADDVVTVKKMAVQSRAWSRSKGISREFCDRPGCYDPLPDASRAPVHYCGRDCRQAMRRVRDRERKWLSRHGYLTVRKCRTASQRTTSAPAKAQPGAILKLLHEGARPVGDYRGNQLNRLSCLAIERDSQPPSKQGNLRDGHSETNLGRRSRPPPT
jgi:hypothetical protein